MLVALCRTGGGKIRWKQGDQPGDPCILPGQRWRLGRVRTVREAGNSSSGRSLGGPGK